MNSIDRKDRVLHEQVVLVGVLLPQSSKRDEDEPLLELAGLAKTAGAIVVDELLQRRETPDKTTYIGKGKVDELKLMVEGQDADCVIFDNDLGPAQVRNLEKAIGVKVLDRTELILDIFANRAQTHEARLAVELAQLQYSLPRLKRMWTHLSRLKMGIGMRGPGEKQLEVDRRLVERRIHQLKTSLDGILRRKGRQIEGRRGHLTVSLVGYTNAGKSTLLNTLTDSEAEAKDKLFTTLVTKTRRWHLPGWGPVLLSDTVGFIRDLPHHLIASFEATLEETIQADLLLHVVDVSSPTADEQIAAVNQVLKDLGIEEKKTLLVLNKLDAIEDPATRANLKNRYPQGVFISAKAGEGIQELAFCVSEALSRDFLELDVEAPIENGRLIAYLADKGEVLSKQYDESTARIHCRIPKEFIGPVEREAEKIHYRSLTNGHPADHATHETNGNNGHAAETNKEEGEF
ncbi:GTPase HflX [Planctomycetales bacterium 10988]|nr:GTPase HflX [Planctomycetales bacterium 10988]